MTAMLLNPKLLLGLALAAALAGGWFYFRYEWIEQGRAEVRAEWDAAVDADREELFRRQHAASLAAAEASRQKEVEIERLRQVIVSLKGSYEKAPPSPVTADCKLSDDRLRIVTDAVRSANDANSGKSKPAVSPATSTGVGQTR